VDELSIVDMVDKSGNWVSSQRVRPLKRKVYFTN